MRIRDGQAILINRGYLATRDEFDPVGLGGITIKGRWTFLAPTDKEGNEAIHLFSIVTRGSTQQGPQYSRVKSGIEIALFSDASKVSSWPRMNARGDDLVISKVQRTNKMEGGLQVGRTYEFEVIDDGLNVLARVTDIEDPTRWVESLARVLRDDSNSDHIVLYSREKHSQDAHYDVGLDDVKIWVSTGPCR